MAKYRLYKNNNKKSVGYNKYYAHKKSQGMVDMSGLIRLRRVQGTARCTSNVCLQGLLSESRSAAVKRHTERDFVVWSLGR